MNRFFVLLILTIIALPAFAQNNWEVPAEGELEDSQIIIEKNRKLELPRIQRNFQLVPKLNNNKDSIVVNYRWKEVSPRLTTVDPTLRVLRIKDDPLNKLYANQVSIGFGNYAGSYLEAHLANKRDKNKSFGLNMFHKHYNRGSVDSRYSAAGNQSINPYIRLIHKDYVLSANAAYDRSDNYAYGEFEQQLNANDLYDRNAFQKLYQNISAEIQVEDRTIENKIDYSFQLAANHFFSSFNTQESSVNYSLNNKYLLNKKIAFGMPIDGYFSQYQGGNESDKQNRYLFRLKPHVSYVLNEAVELQGGLNIIGENDPLRNMSKVHIYPDLGATYYGLKNWEFKAGISGNVENQFYKDFAYLNPYIDQTELINSVLIPFNLQLALSGNLFNRINLTANYTLASVENQQFFKNTISNKEFPKAYSTEVYYIEDNLTQSNASLGLSFDLNKVVSFNAEGFYLKYQHDTISIFPNTPTFRYRFQTKFNIKDKLLFNLRAYGQTESDAYIALDNSGPIGTIINNEFRKIDGFIDLGLEVKYNLTSRSTIFIDTKNLIAKEYKNYLNYPGRGFQLMAGFTYSF